MAKLMTAVLLLATLVTGCVAPPPVAPSQPAAQQLVPTIESVAAENTGAAAVAATAALAAQTGVRLGPASGMMARHHAEIPAQYADLASPVAADAVSLARGQASYTALCATCHGDDGMGNGPAGQALDPAPAPLAHTSQMLSDGYLFWRISEGGHSFGTAMPAWADGLDDQARWDLINYLRSLDAGAGAMGMGPGQGMGAMGRGRGMGEGQMMQRQAEILTAAVAAGLIDENDASFFQQMQQILSSKYATGRQGQGMLIERAIVSGQAVADGVISQADADRYTTIHDQLMQIEHAPLP